MDVTTTIEHVVDIDASAETVWAMWTTADGLGAWWGEPAEIDARPGGAIRVVIDDHHVMVGELVALDPPSHLVFTFGWEDGTVAPGASTVDVAITPRSGGVRLTVRHHGLPLDLVGSHARGWTHFLGLLAREAVR